jgi:hypothetical protein
MLTVLIAANELIQILEKGDPASFSRFHTPRQQCGSGQGTSSSALDANIFPFKENTYMLHGGIGLGAQGKGEDLASFL